MLWSSAYVPSKIASTHSNALWFLACRFTAAGAILLSLALALRQRFPTNARQWLVAATVGALANAAYLGFTYTALHRLSSGMGAIVASTNPLVLSLIAPSLLGEKLSPLKALGLVLGFGGVIEIVLGRAGTGSAAPLDVLLAFCGVCCSVASTVIFKRAGYTQGLVAITSVQLLTAGAVVVPFAMVLPSSTHVIYSWELAVSFIYLVLVMSVGATLLWFWLLRHGEASRVSAYYYLTPAFGLALSALFLHEPVAASDLAGLAAIAAGIVIVQRS